MDKGFHSIPEPKKPDETIMTVPGEGERLWRHVLFGTASCFSMLEGYTALNVPGDPLPHLYSLAERLNLIIADQEDKVK